MRPRRPGTTPIAIATGVAAVLALSACTRGPEYDPATAADLREHVVTASAASAAGDWAAAVAALDALTVELDEARAQGRIGDDRVESILLAMELVRQDLQMAIDEAEDAAERQRLEEAQAALQAELDRLEAERAEQERRAQEEQRRQQEEQQQREQEEQQKQEGGKDKGDEKGEGKKKKKDDDEDDD